MTTAGMTTTEALLAQQLAAFRASLPVEDTSTGLDGESSQGAETGDENDAEASELRGMCFGHERRLPRSGRPC
jgi:hypothetical protein